MKISAHTFITDPKSTGYYTYLPSIQSFLDFADEVIVVDGGTSDGSLKALEKLKGAEKLRIVSNESSYWGKGDLWERPQFAVSREIGYNHCTGDWAVCFESDHLLPETELEILHRELESQLDKGILYSFPLRRCRSGKLVHDLKKRKWWCLNKRLIHQKKFDITWGVHTKGGNERPVSAVQRYSFRDPANGTSKSYWMGDYYPEDGTLKTRLDVYDHFFFTEKQLLAKLQRFENMRSRWEMKAPKRIKPDRRPYKLLSPDEVLESGEHSAHFALHLKNFLDEIGQSKPDIYGLRKYSEKRPWWKLFKKTDEAN